MVRVSFLKYENYKPGHLSYSSMDNYRSCGMRFRLQRIDQVEQKPGLAGLGGNAVHTATEWIDLAEFHGNAIDLDEMEAALERGEW